MKNAILALVLFAVSLSTFAQDPRRPDRGNGRGQYRPAPGHHRPGPGHYRPAPGHRRPGPVIVIRPRPRPYPYPSPRSCQVVMTDRANRVVRRYWGHENGHSMCRSGLRDCNYDLHRMGAWGYRCATVRW